MEGIIKWPCEAMSDWLSQVWMRWFVYVCFQKSVEEGFCNIWDMMLMKQVSLGLHMVIHSSKYFLHVMYTSAIVLIATQWLMGSQACSKTLEVQWDYDDKNTLAITFRMFFLLWVYPIYYIHIYGMVFFSKCSSTPWLPVQPTWHIMAAMAPEFSFKVNSTKYRSHPPKTSRDAIELYSIRIY